MCGEPGHMPELSKSKKKWVLGSECVFSGHSLNKKKIETIECSFPLSNHPMECPVCNELVWRYDMGKHMASKHPGQDCPPEPIVSAAEKEIITKKSKNTKKNLKISDLQKLSDDALKLLPLKDFWDSSKKQWTKSHTELSRSSKVPKLSAFSASKISIKSNSDILPTLTLPLLTAWNDCKD